MLTSHLSALYPENWPMLAAEIKAACGWRCSACDKQCRRPGEPFDGHARTLALAHITQDYEAEAVFVACLCRRCHLLHDAPHSWTARLRRQRVRRRLAGQLELQIAYIANIHL